MADKILTIDSFTESKLKENGSVFIGQAYPVENEEEAENIIAAVKKKHYDAAHHCFAYVFDEQRIKYSDDGEPNGTAGVRILNAIQHFNLSKVLVVVIRHFGGTKLGVGPLGKAYYDSAFMTLRQVRKIEKAKYLVVDLSFDYELLNTAHHLIEKYNVTLVNTEFTPSPAFECLVLPEKLKEFKEDLTEQSSGKAKIDVTGKSIWK